MLVGVLSDTHGHIENTLKAVRTLDERGVDLVIHCGDIGSVDVVHLLNGRPAHFVLGNVDRNERRLRSAVEVAGGTFHGRFGSLQIEGRGIAFLHGDDSRLFQETTASGKWDLVCFGHTHKAESYKLGPTTVLNPGALFRAQAHTLAFVRLPSLQIETVEV